MDLAKIAYSVGRIRMSQRVVWPVLLGLSGTAALVLDAGAALGHWPYLPVQLHSLLVVFAAVAGIMTGVVRLIGPAAEAYRLGRIAGAREQREQCARMCRQPGESGHLAATGTGPASAARVGPPVGTRRLTVIKR